MIIVEALDLFSERGYEGVSMRDIAAKVGIKASSLYNHFSSKADLFDSIVQEMSENLGGAVCSNSKKPFPILPEG
jgi:AcrR family transcriptional regulator